VNTKKVFRISNDVFVSMYIILAFWGFTGSYTAFVQHIITYAVPLLGLYLFFVNWQKIFTEIKEKVIVATVIIFSFISLSHLYNDYGSLSLFYYMTSIVSSIGFGYSLLNYRHYIVPVVLLSYLYYMIIIQIVGGATYLELNELVRYSRNTFTVFGITLLLVLFLSLGIHRNTENRLTSKYLQLYGALIYLLIAYSVIGRSGIITGVILLLSVVATTLGRWWVLLLSSAIIIFYFTYSDTINLYSFIANTKFDYEGLDSPRYYLYNMYLDNIDITGFFLGLKVDDLMPYGYWGGAHNSFLSLHMFTGLSVIIIIVIISQTLVRFLKQRDYLFLFATLSLVIRSFTDDMIIRGNPLTLGLFISLYILSQNNTKIRYMS
jgi:hypothetical protein